MVLLSHEGETLRAGYPLWLYPVGVFGNGGNGVTFFFVLSGYLITTILIRENDAIGRIDMKAFYCRRILRIFPAFYLYLFFIITLAALGLLRISGLDFVFAGTHLINYGRGIELLLGIPDTWSPDYWFIGHFWSLSMEEQFYWMWPLTLLFLLRTRWYGVLLAVILAMPVLRVASYFLFPGLRGSLMMMLHTGSDGIFSGCLLAICLARHPRLSQKLLLPSWAIAGLLLYICPISGLLERVMPRGYDVIFRMTPVIGAMVLFVANILLQEKTTWYQRVLGNRALVFLGRISYSVYLWQQVFVTNLNTTFLGKSPLNLVAAIGAGWLSYRFVELPFIRIKDTYFPSHTKTTAPPLAPPSSVASY
jgi:peptidoglycan/LPS O-acetylase OafA/YrhL